MFWFKYLLLSLISSITLMITLFSYAKISDNYKFKLSIKNIDYRILNKREAIKETPKGFSTLNKELQNWINIKKN